MRIESVSIRRYRAFDQRTVIPLGSLSVITGPNNLGKSTVLSALDIFFGVVTPQRGVGRPRVNRYKYEEDYPKKYEGRAGRRWPTQISVTFNLSEDEALSVFSQISSVAPVSTIEVLVEFAWDSDYEDFRSVIKIQGIDSDDARSAVIGFLRNNVRYVYIAASRNAQDYRRTVFSELIESAVARVSRSRHRLSQLERLLEDVKAEILTVEHELANELRQYLPDVRTLNFSISPFELEGLVSVRDIAIDDGANTPLQQKGDGFKSLFSISLLQHLARRRHSGSLIFAIEEPEAHLHSSAIYEIKDTLRKLSESFQVIITTHSPILIQRDDLKSNVIVQRVDGSDFSAVARSAKSLGDLRQSLGVRPQENMSTAEVVVVVEGQSEERVLPSLLSRCDDILRGGFASGRIRVIGSGGGSNVPGVVRALARDATNCVALLDNDAEGRIAVDRLRKTGFMSPVDVFIIPARDGCADTEFEDLFDPLVYVDAMARDVGLHMDAERFNDVKRRSGRRGNRFAKWSDVMRSACDSIGQDWDSISIAAKTSVASSVALASDQGNVQIEPWIEAIAARVASYLRSP